VVDQVDEAAREALLESLLVAHPDALVAAVDPNRVNDRLPPSIRLRGQQVILPRQAVLLADAESRPAVIKAWDDVHLTGTSFTTARLTNGLDVRVHLVDVRHRHGVIVGMVIGDPGVDLLAVFSGRSEVIPKIGRTEKDAEAIIRHVDDAICRILGYEPGELVGRRTIDLVHPDDQGRAIDAWIDLIGTPGATNRIRLRHQRKDGTWLWMEVTNTNELDAPGGTVVSEMVDIADEMTALEALREREELLGRLTEALPSGVLQLDRDRHVVYANARLHALLGTEPGAATTTELLRHLDAWDAASLEGAIAAALEDGRSTDLEVDIRIPGTRGVRRCSITGRTLTDADGAANGTVLCFDDVTEAAELRAELERRATVDELTGCLNRSAVLARLDEILEQHDGTSSGTAVVFIDLDGFKHVNDTFGHEAGDRLLAGAAERLRAAMRPQDVVGRLGGDEFLVVLGDVDGTDEAMRVATRLAALLAETVEIAGGVPTRIRSSMGVAWTDGRDRTIDADALTAAADRAMYESKRAGACEPVYASV
jgi:diguanylate cyclase (GGDEF)-like protein/PAS domain S-box-containing protein